MSVPNVLLSTDKLSLPDFLKVLTAQNLPMPKAMAAAGKLYKTINTPASLGQLTDAGLQKHGIEDKDDRKLILAAIRKTGYKTKTKTKGNDSAVQVLRKDAASSSNVNETPGPSAISPRKRKRDDDLNAFLPEAPPDEDAEFGSFDFKEVLDESILATKSTVVNRAPIMAAWVTVVAERLGFTREEALSIASVYTEMNAISKGVSLGIFDKAKGKGVELQEGTSQPYVDLMGRRIALYQTATQGWRALLKGTPYRPSTAYAYITGALKQTAPAVMGALILLARAYPTGAELNRKAWGLYVEFRPQVDGWGKRSVVRCDTILGLRPGSGSGLVVGGVSAAREVESAVQMGTVEVDAQLAGASSPPQPEQPEEQEAKRARTKSPDEFDVFIENDPTFDDFDFDGVDALK